MTKKEEVIREMINELKNCLRIFERDRTPDSYGRNERIRRIIADAEGVL